MSDDYPEIIATGLTLEEAAKLFPMTRPMGDRAETRCMLEFGLCGKTLDPRRCDALLPLKPTTSHVKGALLPPENRFPAPTGEWSIEDEWQSCVDLEPALDLFLQKLSVMKDAVAQCIAEQKIRSYVMAVYEVFKQRKPKLTFSLATIDALVAMNAEFSIDWYDFSHYPEEPEDVETEVHGKMICTTTKTSIGYGLKGNSDTSLEEAIDMFLSKLEKEVPDTSEILKTDITVYMEVHHDDLPLRVLPVALLKRMQTYKVNLEYIIC